MLQAIEQLMSIIEAHPNETCDILGRHGVVVMMELLEIPYSNILLSALKLINRVRHSFLT
jgi:hypothetical protein